MSDSGAAAAAGRETRPAAEQSNQPVPLDCCGGLNNVDYSKVKLGSYAETQHCLQFCLTGTRLVGGPFQNKSMILKTSVTAFTLISNMCNNDYSHIVIFNVTYHHL